MTTTQHANRQPFTRSDLTRASVVLQRDGRLFNALVTKVTLDGQTWTVKDFSSRPFFVRWIARILLWREFKALDRVRGIDGFAADAFRLDSLSLAVRYIDGQMLTRVAPECINETFLLRLEELTRTMHRAGIVHLDIRSLGNILLREDGTPAIIDFQAAMCTDGMPAWLRRFLEDIDMSGAYKKWLRFCPQSMGQARRDELSRINGLRRFWVLRGYFGRKK